ncbi:Tctex1 domain-containing protein 2 [Boothiomyces sp. JEL0838]|nr:Tctex1 domain-containing protein 2 [Boothiomyces sp. JEL0838]
MAVDYDIWKLTRLANAFEHYLNTESTNNIIEELLCPETLGVPIKDNSSILIFLLVASLFKLYNSMLLCKITETIFPCFPAYSDKTPINWSLKDRLSLIGLLIGRIKMDNASFINSTLQKFMIPDSTLDFLSRLIELVMMASYPDSIEDLPNYDYDSYFVEPFITNTNKFLSNLTQDDKYELSLVHLYILELVCTTNDDFLFIESFRDLLDHYSEFRPSVVTQVIHQILSDRLTNTVYNPETCSQSSREIADEIKNRLKDMDFDRYKFVVNVIMGEVRGEGVK